MLRILGSVIVSVLLVTTPVAAEGPLAVVSSVSAERGFPPLHLQVVAHSQGGTEDVTFDGFLVSLPTENSPTPVTLTIPRAARTALQRSGDHFWTFQNARAKFTLRGVAGHDQLGATLFSGATTSDIPFSVAITDDPTGIEEGLLILAGGALLVCGAGYIYQVIKTRCGEEAERACKGRVKKVGNLTFGISFDKSKFTLGCTSRCSYECYPPAP
jgi:hypothetical protein